MEEEVILGRDESSEAFKRFLSHYDAPAYIRRARGMQAALDQLLEHCRRRRAEWLELVRLRTRHVARPGRRLGQSAAFPD